MSKLTGIAALAALAFVGAGLLGAASARGEAPLTAFYVDTASPGDGMSVIYEVVIDRVGMVAEMAQVVALEPSLGLGDWEHVDTLAATPDASRIYFVDASTISNPNGRLGFYDFETGTVGVVGIVDWSDTGPTPLGVNVTDLGSFSADGTLYLARADTDALYRVNLRTGFASRVGAFRIAGTGLFVDLQGADIAFDNTGRLHFWTNVAAPGAPRGLYRATATALPIAADIEVDYLGESDALFYTGLAFLDEGLGNLVGSSMANVFAEIDRTNGARLSAFTPSGGSLAAGDMSTGRLAFCTRTIGYWKNHGWNGRTIEINGQTIDEATGRAILRAARGNNFSMLFAQLVAAKLNCASCGGAIPEAEAFLLAAGVFVSNFDAPFADKQERSDAGRLATALDAFNNSNHCR